MICALSLSLLLVGDAGPAQAAAPVVDAEAREGRRADGHGARFGEQTSEELSATRQGHRRRVELQERLRLERVDAHEAQAARRRRISLRLARVKGKCTNPPGDNPCASSTSHH